MLLLSGMLRRGELVFWLFLGDVGRDARVFTGSLGLLSGKFNYSIGCTRRKD